LIPGISNQIKQQKGVSFAEAKASLVPPGESSQKNNNFT
jgi:hypothetical protein